MKKDKVFIKNSDIVARVIDDEVILMPIYKTSDDINCIYTLNKSAAFIWDAIDGRKTAGDIKKIVSEKFEATPKEIDKEMIGLLKDLREIKAVSCK
jgi:tRNA uridine 5-carbamoylmethylation protein Kti12